MKKIFKFLKSKLWNRKFDKSNSEKRSQMLRDRYGVKIGVGCDIFRSVNFSTEPYLITIGNNVSTSINVRFVTHDGACSVIRNLYPEDNDVDLFGEIIVGNNVFLGIDSILLPNTIIGDNVIIAARAVVKGKIPSNVVVGGVPAKVICTIEEFFNKNKDKFMHVTNFSMKEKKDIILAKMEK